MRCQAGSEFEHCFARPAIRVGAYAVNASPHALEQRIPARPDRQTTIDRILGHPHTEMALHGRVHVSNMQRAICGDKNREYGLLNSAGAQADGLGWTA